MPLETDNKCFACGANNPVGLRLNIIKQSDKVSTDFVAAPPYQGWKDIVHGGIVATILDELMVWAALHKGFTVVTAEMNVRFKSPMQVGERVHGFGRIVAVKHGLVLTEATLEKTDGTSIATATGKMLKYQ